MNTLKPHTRNVTRVFRTATAEEIEAGRDWYRDALRIAETLATVHEIPVHQAVGVIAALSPLNSWGANINLTARFLEQGGMTTGYLKAGLAKATRILEAETSDDVVTILNGNKIVNFFWSIYSAGVEGVCIDRHAMDIAFNVRHNDGTRPSLSAKRYNEIAETYVRAATILSRELGEEITPAQVQSVTWTIWRRRYWAAGAFDGHAEIS